MSSTTNNGQFMNNKLKDNPFFANRNQEQKDAKPPLEKINKSIVTQPLTSKLPKAGESRKHVRASVQKMATTSIVSSNPWKAKMMKPAARKSLDRKAAVENITSKSSLEKDSPAKPVENTTSKTFDTAKASTASNKSFNISTSVSKPLSTAKSSTSSNKPADTVKPYTTSSKTIDTAKPSINTSKPSDIKKLSTSGGKVLETVKPSTGNTKSMDTKKLSTSSNKAFDTNKPTTMSSKSVGTVITSTTSNNEVIDTVKPPTTAISKTLDIVKPSINTSKSLDTKKPLKSNSKPPNTKKLSTGNIRAPDTITTNNKASDNIKPSTNTSSTIDAVKPSTNCTEILDTTKTATNKATAPKVAPESQLEKIRQRFGPTTKKPAPEALIMPNSIVKKANTVTEKVTNKSSFKASPESPKPSIHSLQPTTRQDIAQEVKGMVDSAMKTPSPVSINDKPAYTKPILAQVPTMDEDEKPLSIVQKEVDEDSKPLGVLQKENKLTLDSMLESLRSTSNSTQLSIASVQSFSDMDSDSSYEDHPPTTKFEGTSKRVTAFGIELPWSQFAQEQPIPIAEPSSSMTIDSAQIALQLAVPHAIIAAMNFPILSIVDAEKHRKRYTQAKSSVDGIRDRVLLETRIQRTYASMIKLAVGNESRSLVSDLQYRTNNIDELTQELYYTFSHACESQEKYLHHIAGTLAVTFGDERPIVTPKKRREEYYPDIVLRLENLAKKCSIHVPRAFTTQSMDRKSLSDDENFSDDSMFMASVRTSMTSFDDHQQAHALLEIIERQLSTTSAKHADKELENEVARLRKREMDMQHRLDAQFADFTRQQKEWEYQSTQPDASAKRLEQQLEREIEARKSLEQTKRQLEEDSHQALLRQQELQRQLDKEKKSNFEKVQQLQESVQQAKQRDLKLQSTEAELTRRIHELQEEADRYRLSMSDSGKVEELTQALLQAKKREKELARRVQELEAAAHKVEEQVEYRNLKQNMEGELKVAKQRETEALDRLDKLDGQVAHALSATSTTSLEAMVNKIHEQKEPSSDTDKELVQLHEAFKLAQEEYTRREAALMLQSASVEAELGAVFKEYDKLTRNIADFNHERKKYEQQVQALMREKQLLDKQLADFKVKDGIGKDGQTMTLRKEFRQLMATVKAEHEQELEKEAGKRRQVENELRNMKHELELKRWDTVNTSVQTNFVAYPIM